MSARHDYPYVDLGPSREQHRQMCEEIDRLRRWKAEAIIVLGYWDDAFDRCGIDGLVGDSKPDLMAREILQLRSKVDVS